MHEPSGIDAQVDSVRRFNRFYTRNIGILDKTYLQTPFSITEARVIYELARRKEANIRDLCSELGLDPGYISRLVASLVRRKIVTKRSSQRDRRQAVLSLTGEGVRAFKGLDDRARESVGRLLSPLAADNRDRIVEAMDRILASLAGSALSPKPVVLRSPGPGDFGWVVASHGRFYAQEYGWNEHFEALVASIVSKFIERFDTQFERCWIAEQGGVNVGSVFCVKRSAKVAQLRLLLVTPDARGCGLGKKLVDECIQFARLQGYSKMVLWTNDVLIAARRIYEKSGFHLIREERHSSFGRHLVGQYWELKL